MEECCKQSEPEQFKLSAVFSPVHIGKEDDSVNLRSPSLSVSESGNEELCSELSPVLDERSRRSLRCCVDGVSDSPYTSSNLRTDGQPKVGRGLPSIDDYDNSDCSFFFLLKIPHIRYIKQKKKGIKRNE